MDETKNENKHLDDLITEIRAHIEELAEIGGPEYTSRKARGDKMIADIEADRGKAGSWPELSRIGVEYRAMLGYL